MDIIATTNPPKRIRIENNDLIDESSRSYLLERWKEQDLYVDYLEARLNQLQQSIDTNERLREKETECRKLKSMLNYRFLTKSNQQQSLEQMRDINQTPSLSRLRQSYLDPSVNLIFGHMRHEMDQNRQIRDQVQKELQAFQFTSDSKIGKMLMAKCQKLIEENKQLGNMISSEYVAKLEGKIALQNRLLSNMKDCQKEYEEILLDMDTYVDRMSNTLLLMRSQLNGSHRQINLLNEENTRLKTLHESHTNQSSTTNMNNFRSDRSDIKLTYSSTRITPNTDETISSLNELMDVDSISLNSTTNEHSLAVISLENGIVAIS